jgi:predicted transcriptional regulator
MELVDYERQYMDAGDQVVARETKRPRKNRMMSKLAMQAMSMNMTMNMSQEANESFSDAGDLSQFLVQRMDEGSDSLSLEGPAVTGEVGEEPEEVTSISKMVVEGMDHVPWYFGCRYSCQICQKVWHYPQAARYHLDSVHKLTRAAYESQYGTCEVETRIFHCSICQRSMKCERDIIKYHLEAKHSMSLEEYVEQCPMPVVTIGESRRSNAATHARGTVPGLPLLQRYPGITGSPVKPEVLAGQEKGAPWYRGSNFTCIPCQRQFTAQVSYISHINSKHGMNLREYREQYGSVEEIRQYQCKVPGCTRYVSWTYSGINDHLKSHSLSMAEYEAQYLGIGVGQQAPAPPVVVKEPEGPPVGTMETEDFSSVVERWSNGPGRECALCQTKVTIEFASHLLEQHQVTLTEYSNQHPGQPGEATHVCHLCKQGVQHQNNILQEHMKGHGITIEHYYHKFIGSTNTDATNAEIIISKVTQSPPALKRPPTIPPPIKVRKNHWANGCSYQCIMCKGQKYPEEFMFKKHILTAHNMSTEEYQNNFGNPALVKQLHICKVGPSYKHHYDQI